MESGQMWEHIITIIMIIFRCVTLILNAWVVGSSLDMHILGFRQIFLSVHN